ncbi:sialate O-acetylesterase [Aurantimonas sp. 22II-16-19i]|uniref:sialate O-acetylesterase n=1 Tax=Aurantimonas sp. 22II-16-19i TaxID=1317114 RepID=UPI0009F7FB41|nr:sialate O-acetylesterase [Aurantimonas sp. 22II-16-19i]ORE91014.1 hypothetical protein ATO4_20169 [Aurantimonas sp. 22II-16-19i]
MSDFDPPAFPPAIDDRTPNYGLPLVHRDNYAKETDTYRLRSAIHAIDAKMAEIASGVRRALVLAGQSNPASSNAAAAGGDLTPHDRVLLFNPDTGSFARWDPSLPWRYSTAGICPGGRGNQGFSAAKRIAEEDGDTVYCIVNAWPGTGIQNWYNPDTATVGVQAIELDAYVTAALATPELSGVTKIDFFAWGQGESNPNHPSGDALGSLKGKFYFRRAFKGFYNWLTTRPWMDAAVPMSCMQLKYLDARGVYSSGSWRNDFYLHLADYGYANVGCAMTTDLSSDPDLLHFTGASQTEIGKRHVNVWRQLRTKASANEPVDTTQTGFMPTHYIEHRLRFADPTSNATLGAPRGLDSGSYADGRVYIAQYTHAPEDGSPAGGTNFTGALELSLDGLTWSLAFLALRGLSSKISFGTNGIIFNGTGGIKKQSYALANFQDKTHIVNTAPFKQFGVEYACFDDSSKMMALGVNATSGWLRTKSGATPDTIIPV